MRVHFYAIEEKHKNRELFRFLRSIVLSECVPVCERRVKCVSFSSLVLVCCVRVFQMPYIQKHCMLFTTTTQSHSYFTLMTVCIADVCTTYDTHENFGSMHNSTMNPNELQCARLTTVNSFTLQWNAFNLEGKANCRYSFLIH